MFRINLKLVKRFLVLAILITFIPTYPITKEGYCASDGYYGPVSVGQSEISVEIPVFLNIKLTYSVGGISLSSTIPSSLSRVAYNNKGSKEQIVPVKSLPLASGFVSDKELMKMANANRSDTMPLRLLIEPV